jgi:hypothetical protein
MFPYEAYYDFFAKWFGNPFYLAIAFILWAAITITFFRLSRVMAGWLRITLTVIVSVIHYMVFGMLFAPSWFGGQAEFLYNPAYIGENIFDHGGWYLIMFWPFYLVQTGGMVMVIAAAVIVFGIRYFFGRKRKNNSKT